MGRTRVDGKDDVHRETLIRRGVPLITVLFFATYMLPFFLPVGWRIDALLRVLIGVVLFAGAYMAEVVRAGCDWIVTGSAIFHSKDPEATVREMRQIAAHATAVQC